MADKGFASTPERSSIDESEEGQYSAIFRRLKDQRAGMLTAEPVSVPPLPSLATSPHYRDTGISPQSTSHFDDKELELRPEPQRPQPQQQEPKEQRWDEPRGGDPTLPGMRKSAGAKKVPGDDWNAAASSAWNAAEVLTKAEAVQARHVPSMDGDNSKSFTAQFEALRETKVAAAGGGGGGGGAGGPGGARGLGGGGVGATSAARDAKLRESGPSTKLRKPKPAAAKDPKPKPKGKERQRPPPEEPKGLINSLKGWFAAK